MERREFIRKLVVSVGLVGALGVSGYAAWRTRSRSGGELDKTIRKQIEAEFAGLGEELKRVLHLAEQEINASLKQFEKSLQASGSQFADDKITRRGVAALVIEMAKDRVSKGNRAEAWLETNWSPYAQVSFEALEQSLDQVDRNFEQQKVKAIKRISGNIEQILASHPGSSYEQLDAAILQQRVEAALSQRGLKSGMIAGFGSVGVVTGGGGHAYARMSTAIMAKIQRALYRGLGPTAAKVAGRAGASLLTAKIPPVALLIGVAGAGLTARDVIRLRKSAQSDFKAALAESIEEMGKEVDEKIVRPMKERLSQIQAQKDAIANEIVRTADGPRLRVFGSGRD